MFPANDAQRNWLETVEWVDRSTLHYLVNRVTKEVLITILCPMGAISQNPESFFSDPFTGQRRTFLDLAFAKEAAMKSVYDFVQSKRGPATEWN